MAVGMVVGKGLLKFGKKHLKDIVTKQTKGQAKSEKATQGQRTYRSGQKKGAAVGAGGVGLAMADKKSYKGTTRGQIAGKKGPKTSMTYTVKKGDTLTSIAKSAGTTVANLKKINKIEDANKIKAGRKLKLAEKKMAMGGMAKKTKGMAKGGLKTPTANQKGLKKLPTSVRNTMGL